MTSPREAGSGYHFTDRGVFGVTGEDAEDFIERTVTNEVEGIDEMSWIPSLLLDPKGKTTDILNIIHLENDAYLVTSPRYRDTAEKWRENIFIEDIDIEITDELVTWVIGDDLSAVKDELNVSGSIDENTVFRASIDDVEPIIYGEKLNGSERLSIVSDLGTEKNLKSFLTERGLEELDPETVKTWRILKNVPSLENELINRIPLGAGGHRFISFDKGCFVGQEIVARIEQRGGGASEELRSISLEAEVEEGSEIHENEEEAGIITSVACLSDDKWIALAIVDIDAGDVLSVGEKKVKAVSMNGDGV